MYNAPEAEAWDAHYRYREPPPAASETEPETLLDDESARPSGFAEWFVLSQTVLPALMFLPGSQTYRLPLRVGAYGISLFAFALWWFDRGGRKQGKHPAERFLMFVLVILVLSVAHPLTNSLQSGLAQTLLYFAIFCPLFWARGYVTTRRQLQRVLLLLLICNGINSIVGVLQVYDPGRWMPRELSAMSPRARMPWPPPRMWVLEDGSSSVRPVCSIHLARCAVRERSRRCSV